MKNLWLVLPPLLSDSYGFVEVLKKSDGCGIIDDSGHFNADHKKRDRRDGPPRDRRERERGPRPERRVDSRIVTSGLNIKDIVGGTGGKVMEAFRGVQEVFHPAFALFCAAPCGSMVGTDYAEIAGSVTAEYGIPAGAVELTGQKTYDIGISKTTEALVMLLAQGGDVIKNSVNVLGATELDWAAEDIAALDAWLEAQGYRVLARPGREVTAAQLADMGRAELNLVVSAAGLAAARFLEQKFGTPYIAAAPFGSAQLEKLKEPLSFGAAAPAPSGEAEVLIIGEQFTANAVRACLEEKGMHADVATFYTLDKSCARAGDLKLKSEDAARTLVNTEKYRLIVADPMMKPLLKRDCGWIDLPHRAMGHFRSEAGIPLFGDKLDRLIEEQM